jgi:hypothetical protein
LAHFADEGFKVVMMKKLILLSLFILNLYPMSSSARHPAVDNFIGVEPSNYQNREPSSEKPYNFEKGSGLKTREVASFEAPSKNKGKVGLWGYIFFSLILGAPFLTWGLMMRKLDNQGLVDKVKMPKKDDHDDIQKAS